MKFIIKKYKIVIFSMLGVLLLLSYGCGNDSHTPSYPRSRSDLTLEILKSLEDQNHELTLHKLARLRELDPTNIFLANLEILELNNAIIINAQKSINSEDLPKSLAVLNEGIKKHGRHKDLMIAQQKLAIATRISDILVVFRNPHNAVNLKKASLQLKELGGKYKPAAIFIPLAERKKIESEEMDKWEQKRGLGAFCSYLDVMIDNNDADLNLLFAVLEIIDPEHPTLLKYLDNLKVNGDLSLLTYESGDSVDFDFSEDITENELETPSNENIIEEVNETGAKQIEKEENIEPNKKKKKEWWNKFEL